MYALLLHQQRSDFFPELLNFAEAKAVDANTAYH
jgi:hypothetical protein